MVKTILDGSYADEEEDLVLNKLLYELIPSQDKPLFKSRFLKSNHEQSLITSANNTENVSEIMNANLNVT
jgi:hypothetical protein